MKIFIDSSLILAFLAGQDERAYNIIENIENRVFVGYINAIVIGEVIHGYLRLVTGLSSKRIRQLLAKRDKNIIKVIKEDVEPVLRLFVTLPIISEPREVISIIEDYGLMPADSIIVLTCRHYGIDTIATLDEDFKRVSWLRVIP